MKRTSNERAIPTFALFQKENQALAERYIGVTQALFTQGEHIEALDSYAKILQYTKNWRNYRPLPILYRTMNKEAEARLATLYLALYQMEAGDVSMAIESLEEVFLPKGDGASKDGGEQKKVRMEKSERFILSELYRLRGDLDRALEILHSDCDWLEVEERQRAVTLAKELLTKNPHSYGTYTLLVDFLSPPLMGSSPTADSTGFTFGAKPASGAFSFGAADATTVPTIPTGFDASFDKRYHDLKVFALLKGALHALEKGEQGIAASFLQDAKKLSLYHFTLLDHQIELEVKGLLEETKKEQLRGEIRTLLEGKLKGNRCPKSSLLISLYELLFEIEDSPSRQRELREILMKHLLKGSAFSFAPPRFEYPKSISFGESTFGKAESGFGAGASAAAPTAPTTDFGWPALGQSARDSNNPSRPSSGGGFSFGAAATSTFAQSVRGSKNPPRPFSGKGFGFDFAAAARRS